MPRDRQAVGSCPQCKTGTINCTHNAFADAIEEIHSWEHRCNNCGERETNAVRTKTGEPPPSTDPTICPFCGRQSSK